MTNTKQGKQPAPLQSDRKNDAARDRAVLYLLNAYKGCHIRWHLLFSWLVEVIKKECPKVYRRVMEALKREGLAKENRLVSALMNEEPLPFPTEDLYSMEPSDETLKRVRQLTKLTRLPSLRGKTRQKTDPFLAAVTYSTIYGAIKNLARKGYSSPKNLGRGLAGNIAKRYCDLKDRLNGIKGALPGDLPSDGDLNKWARKLSNRELARRVTAHVLGVKPTSLKRILAEAKKKSPILKEFVGL